MLNILVTGYQVEKQVISCFYAVLENIFLLVLSNIELARQRELSGVTAQGNTSGIY